MLSLKLKIGNKMHTLESFIVMASKCKFRDWIFHVSDKTGQTPYLQIQFWDKDFQTGKLELQKCRKWDLSYHMVDYEFVRTVRMALHTAMQHEIDETFTYDNAKLFHPHFDLDALIDFAKRKKISVRKPMPILTPK